MILGSGRDARVGAKIGSLRALLETEDDEAEDEDEQRDTSEDNHHVAPERIVSA